MNRSNLLFITFVFHQGTFPHSNFNISFQLSFERFIDIFLHLHLGIPPKYPLICIFWIVVLHIVPFSYHSDWRHIRTLIKRSICCTSLKQLALYWPNDSIDLITSAIIENAENFASHPYYLILLHFTRAVTSNYMPFENSSKPFFGCQGHQTAMLDYFHDPEWPANSGVQTVPNKHIKRVGWCNLPQLNILNTIIRFRHTSNSS